MIIWSRTGCFVNLATANNTEVGKSSDSFSFPFQRKHNLLEPSIYSQRESVDTHFLWAASLTAQLIVRISNTLVDILTVSGSVWTTTWTTPSGSWFDHSKIFCLKRAVWREKLRVERELRAEFDNQANWCFSALPSCKTRLLDGYQLLWVVALELKIPTLTLVIFSTWNQLLIIQNKEFPWLISNMSKYSKQDLPFLANGGQHLSFITGSCKSFYFSELGEELPSQMKSATCPLQWQQPLGKELVGMTLQLQPRQWTHRGPVCLVWEIQTYASLNA